MQWIVLAYLLAITTLIVTAGRLGDLVGRRGPDVDDPGGQLQVLGRGQDRLGELEPGGRRTMVIDNESHCESDPDGAERLVWERTYWG